MNRLDLGKANGAHYLAFVLTREYRDFVLGKFPPSYSDVYAHHVTLEFEPTAENIVQNFQDLLTGEPPRVHIIGIAQDDFASVECLAISINGKTERPDGSFYHLTLSTEPGVGAVKANELRNQIERFRGFYSVQGSFQLMRKSDDY